jgi:hypothetical protein
MTIVNARKLAAAQVPKFAQGGWQAGSTGESDGMKWRWSREGANFVICGARLGPMEDYADPDIQETFTPEEVARLSTES